MNLKELNNKYIYQADKERFSTSLDIWELPKDNNVIYADCESYCRFLRNIIEEFKNYDYYYCRINGSGHCILIKDDNVIDCNVKKVVSLLEYQSMFVVTELKKYNWFVIASKIAFAKVYTLFNKGK